MRRDDEIPEVHSPKDIDLFGAETSAHNYMKLIIKDNLPEPQNLRQRRKENMGVTNYGIIDNDGTRTNQLPFTCMQ